MITKEQIIEILCNHGGYMDRSRTDQGVHEDNFADVADEILSKLSQHDVSRQVCTIGGECKSRGENNECKGTAYCGYKKHTFC